MDKVLSAYLSIVQTSWIFVSHSVFSSLLRPRLARLATSERLTNLFLSIEAGRQRERTAILQEDSP